MEDIFLSLQDAIYKGNAQRAKELTELALKKGYSIKAITEKALFPPMEDMGSKLGSGAVFIPDILLSSRAMHAAMYVLKPIISHYHGHGKGTIVIGTVAGDLHDIGKNLVSMLLSGIGFSVVDLGADVPKEAFIDAVRQYNAEILALSSLLTTTMPEIKNVIELVGDEGLRPQVSIMVGGAPVTAAYAKAVKADVYTKNMFEAAEAADLLVMRKISKYTL